MFEDDVHLDVEQSADVDSDVEHAGVDQQANCLVRAALRRRRCRQCRRPRRRLAGQLQTRVQQGVVFLQLTQLHDVPLPAPAVRHPVQLQQRQHRRLSEWE